MLMISSKIEKNEKGKKIGTATYLVQTKDDLKLARELCKKSKITFDPTKKGLIVSNELK
jgi:hypothetical protein